MCYLDVDLGDEGKNYLLCEGRKLESHLDVGFVVLFCFFHDRPPSRTVGIGVGGDPGRRIGRRRRGRRRRRRRRRGRRRRENLRKRHDTTAVDPLSKSTISHSVGVSHVKRSEMKADDSRRK